LTHVFHHTLPDQDEAYTHRSGRTGRAGKKGTSLAFITPRDKHKITRLEKLLDVSFDPLEVPTLEKMKTGRINQWINRIQSTEIHPEAESLYESVESMLSDTNKETLLKKIISMHLEQLRIYSVTSDDLNASTDGPKKIGKPGYHRFFINVGLIDGLNEQDLIDLLAEVSDTPRKYFSEVSLQKKCAFFELSEKVSSGFSELFEGLEIDGRPLRVNLDQMDKGRRKHNGNKKDWKNRKWGKKRTH
jgi:ATP-dependent RNA helicase DeaD